MCRAHDARRCPAISCHTTPCPATFCGNRLHLLCVGQPPSQSSLSPTAPAGAHCREEGLSFKHVVTFNLDEYLGMHPDALQASAALVSA